MRDFHQGRFTGRNYALQLPLPRRRPASRIAGLVGTYTDPKHIIAYTDGEVRRQFNVCFAARITGGQVEISDESTEIRFVPPEEIKQLPMHHTQRLRLQHFLK